MINNYRFGSYAVLAIGLINLRYQSGTESNLLKSSFLILLGLSFFIVSFIPAMKPFLLNKRVRIISLLILGVAIVYSFLI